MSDSYIQQLFAERIGGVNYGKSTAIYKFEKIKRAKAAAKKAKPDVALIDIRLGEESGIELTAQLIDADPERRVVLYTGSSEIELLISGLDSGARGYAYRA